MTLIEILQEHRVQFRTAGESKDVRQGWVGLHCPYCGRPDDRFYLGWNLSKKFFSCWSCGWLPAAKVLNELTRLPIYKCRELLGEAEAEPGVNKDELRGHYSEPTGVRRMRDAHRTYLAARGLEPRVVERLWGVRGIGIALELQWRLFIPIYLNDEPVTWTTRTIGPKSPRYISAKPEQEALSINDVLYGADHCRHAAIAVEGPLDCFAIGPGAVGLCGIGFSPAQVLRLSRYPIRAVCFDNEPAAQKRASALCDLLAPFPGTTHNIQLDAKDPGSAGKREIRLLRKFLE